jgi:hypothetical protein
VRRFFAIFPVMVAALAVGGCNTSGSLFGGGQTTQPAVAPQQQGVGSTAHTALFGAPQVESRPADFSHCPRIEIRDGSNVWRQGGEGPLELRYQATIMELARECRVDGQMMTVRVGVEGRVLTGPKGEGGRLTLPIRIAVTQGLSNPVWTRLYQVPIDVPAGSPSVSFTQVEEQVQFQLPPEAGDLARYIIFVGFDNQAAQPERQRRGRARTAQR